MSNGEFVHMSCISFVWLSIQCIFIMTNTPVHGYAPVLTILACGSAFALLVCKLILAHVSVCLCVCVSRRPLLVYIYIYIYIYSCFQREF